MKLKTLPGFKTSRAVPEPPLDTVIPVVAELFVAVVLPVDWSGVPVVELFGMFPLPVVSPEEVAIVCVCGFCV